MSAHKQALHVVSQDWSLFLRPRGAIAVTAMAPYGWPGEFSVLFAPKAVICAGLWNSSWQVCPPASVVVFDTDFRDAEAYGALTHETVYAGQSAYGATTFWYAQGSDLPDPATVFERVTPATATSRPVISPAATLSPLATITPAARTP